MTTALGVPRRIGRELVFSTWYGRCQEEVFRYRSFDWPVVCTWVKYWVFICMYILSVLSWWWRRRKV